MQYRVFYTDQPLHEGEYEPDRAQLVLVGYDTKDEAMDFARASSLRSLTMCSHARPYFVLP